MANDVEPNSSAGWVVWIVIAILVAIAIVWVGSSRWGSDTGSGRDARGNAPAHHAAGTNANNGTTGENAGHGTSGTAGANTSTGSASGASSSARGNANVPGSLSSMPARPAASGNTR